MCAASLVCSTTLSVPEVSTGRSSQETRKTPSRRSAFLAAIPLWLGGTNQYAVRRPAAPLDNVIARLALDHVGQPEDATGAVMFMCSEQASFITGVTLPIDGGFVLYNAGSY